MSASWQAKVVDRPLQLREPVRSSTIMENPRVPPPDPAKPAPVSNEGVVRIVGGEVPAREPSAWPSCRLLSPITMKTSKPPPRQ